MHTIITEDTIKRSLRVGGLVCLDVVLSNLAAFLALWVRLDFSTQKIIVQGYLTNWVDFCLIYSVVIIAIFIPLKLYNSIWAFAGAEELVHIVCAGGVVMVLEVTAVFLGVLRVPRSFPVLNAMFLIGLTVASRFSYRMVRGIFRKGEQHPTQKRTMLVGAGEAGMMALREFQSSDHSENRVLCVIDDDKTKHGQYLRGVKIVGDRNDIVHMVQEYRIEEIIVAMPGVSAASRRDILGFCQRTGCKLKTLPGLFQLANGEVSIQKIRNVDVLDLLGRDSVEVDLSQIAGYLTGKTVLVTGGGGSIGSELCRQIAKYQPKRLVIFDIYENNAYSIQQELWRGQPDLDLAVCIGSVRDTARVDMLFETYHPDIVFHAAAHKHVPLMEDSPNEAIKNNVFGTLHVAQAADRYGAGAFVLISTDKAVNPTNIMGASKRMCEMVIQNMANRSKTKFVAVRFGNVLGSNGSVIPLFKQQIAEGGPVTVTHRDIIRYFMTIPEAVSLVLQAGSYAQRGEIFVLDMGEPVRIDDLARNMIRLSGFEPDVDIKIEYTGLRPGEKLYEEMLMQEEGMRSTPNKLIYIGKPVELDETAFAQQLQSLEQACWDNCGDIRCKVAEIVPTYHPKNDVISPPPKA